MLEDTGKYEYGSIWWRSLGVVRSLNSNLSDIFIEFHQNAAYLKCCRARLPFIFCETARVD